MLEKLKFALKISGTAFDSELSDLIDAAIADLRLAGINVYSRAGPSESTGSPLLDRAIILYCKGDFADGDEAERYKRAYEAQKATLCLVCDYNA